MWCRLRVLFEDLVAGVVVDFVALFWGWILSGTCLWIYLWIYSWISSWIWSWILSVDFSVDFSWIFLRSKTRPNKIHKKNNGKIHGQIHGKIHVQNPRSKSDKSIFKVHYQIRNGPSTLY